ncbi:MAG: oleate hydratase, partial [Actinomycetes bacterium]
MRETTGRHVVVVGGGISGLAAAWFLARDGGRDLRVTVLEGAAQIGGKLRVSEVAGVPVDEGAES